MKKLIYLGILGLILSTSLTFAKANKTDCPSGTIWEPSTETCERES